MAYLLFVLPVELPLLLRDLAGTHFPERGLAHVRSLYFGEAFFELVRAGIRVKASNFYKQADARAIGTGPASQDKTSLAVVQKESINITRAESVDRDSNIIFFNPRPVMSCIGR